MTSPQKTTGGVTEQTRGHPVLQMRSSPSSPSSAQLPESPDMGNCAVTVGAGLGERPEVGEDLGLEPGHEVSKASGLVLAGLSPLPGSQGRAL